MSPRAFAFAFAFAPGEHYIGVPRSHDYSEITSRHIIRTLPRRESTVAPWEKLGLRSRRVVGLSGAPSVGLMLVIHSGLGECTLSLGPVPHVTCCRRGVLGDEAAHAPTADLSCAREPRRLCGGVHTELGAVSLVACGRWGVFADLQASCVL